MSNGKRNYLKKIKLFDFYLNNKSLIKIHDDAKHHDDLNQYQYTIYRRFNMDKHPKPSVSQILLRMFYALTSSDYDYRKGIKKVSSFI